MAKLLMDVAHLNQTAVLAPLCTGRPGLSRIPCPGDSRGRDGRQAIRPPCDVLNGATRL